MPVERYLPEYVIQFSKDVRGEIEARYRKSAMMLADRMLEALAARGEAALQALDASRAALLAQSAAAARYTGATAQRRRRGSRAAQPAAMRALSLRAIAGGEGPARARGA